MKLNNEVIGGWFEYKSAGDGWEDTFRIVDDDGMPFDLEPLKRFVGKAVHIIIIEAPDMEARSRADTSREPYIYQQIGMTREQYRREREAKSHK